MSLPDLLLRWHNLKQNETILTELKKTSRISSCSAGVTPEQGRAKRALFLFREGLEKKMTSDLMSDAETSRHLQSTFDLGRHPIQGNLV